MMGWGIPQFVTSQLNERRLEDINAGATLAGNLESVRKHMREKKRGDEEGALINKKKVKEKIIIEKEREKKKRKKNEE